MMELDTRIEKYIASEDMLPIGGMEIQYSSNYDPEGKVDIYGYDGNEMWSGTMAQIQNWQEVDDNDQYIVPDWVAKLFMDLEIIEDVRTPDNDTLYPKTH